MGGVSSTLFSVGVAPFSAKDLYQQNASECVHTYTPYISCVYIVQARDVPKPDILYNWVSLYYYILWSYYISWSPLHPRRPLSWSPWMLGFALAAYPTSCPSPRCCGYDTSYPISCHYCVYMYACTRPTSPRSPVIACGTATTHASPTRSPHLTHLRPRRKSILPHTVSGDLEHFGRSRTHFTVQSPISCGCSHGSKSVQFA